MIDSQVQQQALGDAPELDVEVQSEPSLQSDSFYLLNHLVFRIPPTHSAGT